MTDTISTVSQVAEYTTIVQNVFLVIASAAAALIAYLGLTTWRKELKGKSEYAKAKEVLKAVYKVRRAFNHVRNPIIYQYEYPERMRDSSGHLEKKYDYEGTAHVYENRWKFLAEAFEALEEENLDAQVEWGPGFQEVIVPLRRCKVELQIAISNFLEGKKNPHERRERAREDQEDERSVLYHLGENSRHDKFTPQINAAIEEFEKKLRPYIKK
jgi:hypothetical protein